MPTLGHFSNVLQQCNVSSSLIAKWAFLYTFKKLSESEEMFTGAYFCFFFNLLLKHVCNEGTLSISGQSILCFNCDRR